jgi:hypothetical protein
VERYRRALHLARTGNLDIALGNRIRRHRAKPPRLLRRPVPLPENAWSARRLNALAGGLGDARSYLEVGIWAGATFELVDVPVRVGVDPEPRFDLHHLPRGARVFPVTSDEFFAATDATFDLVFLDGLHTYEQTYRDLVNALRTCPRGLILIDDVVPSDEISAIPDQAESLRRRAELSLVGTPWHGDVFRMVACLADHHPELDWRTIVNGGNPQLVLWRRRAGHPVTAVTDAALARYSSFSYAEVFGEGIPEYFRATSEPDALAAGLRGVAAGSAG